MKTAMIGVTASNLLRIPALWVVVVLVLVVGSVMCLRRWPQLWFRPVWWLNYFYCRLMFRLRVEGAVPADLTGPAILVANHTSGADPPLVSAALKRRISFVVAQEIYTVPGVHWFCDIVGCIPVARTGRDLPALREAMRRLENGGIVGIFPGGGIRHGDLLAEVKPGVALLALKTGAPVLPVYIHGSPVCKNIYLALFCPARVTVSFGEPLRFETAEGKPLRERPEEIAETIRVAINELARSFGTSKS